MTGPRELPYVDPNHDPFARGRVIRLKGTETENKADQLPTNADFGFPENFNLLGSADLYSRKLGIPVDEIQRLYRDEQEKFLQLLDQHKLRITVRPEDL